MHKKHSKKILIGLVVLIGLLAGSAVFILEPWLENKIRKAIAAADSGYLVEIVEINVSVFSFSVELDSISIRTREESDRESELNLSIGFLKVKGIHAFKYLFKKEVEINEIKISRIAGNLNFSKDSAGKIVSPLNIHLRKVSVSSINLSFRDTSSSELYKVEEGALGFYDIDVVASDTLYPALLGDFDFDFRRIYTITADSMYGIDIHGAVYSSGIHTLIVDSAFVNPSYPDYDFTSRKKYQTDRIEAEFRNFYMYDFSLASFIDSANLVCSYVEIDRMKLEAFRDRRREFLHKDKPMLQDLLYNYQGKIDIDSIILDNGDVTYREHASEANHPGTITFNNLNAKIFTVCNDTLRKNEKLALELKANALLMGKGKMNVIMTCPLFERSNSFSLSGNLESINAMELNPMLERNAFLYVTSGDIQVMSFNFQANRNRAEGGMTLLYQNLNLAVKNKDTDDTTAFKEKLFSVLANTKSLNSNPLPGKEVRKGVIEFDRDPEKFLFHYCFKS
ncbi:MAG: hypothetical protein KA444_07875, partial [Bacteroidia bacterium]|nr:hypothetical protein [Bacteroidia bacterium]